MVEAAHPSQFGGVLICDVTDNHLHQQCVEAQGVECRPSHSYVVVAHQSSDGGWVIRIVCAGASVGLGWMKFVAVVDDHKVQETARNPAVAEQRPRLTT